MKQRSVFYLIELEATVIKLLTELRRRIEEHSETSTKNEKILKRTNQS